MIVMVEPFWTGKKQALNATNPVVGVVIGEEGV